MPTVFEMSGLTEVTKKRLSEEEYAADRWGVPLFLCHCKI